MKQKYLFHGSSELFTILDPSKCFDNPKLAYATDSWAYALVRAGKQGIYIREDYHGLNKPMELAELFPNAFLDMFECKGYVYLFDPKDFVKVGNEYVTDKPVIPVDIKVIDNVWYWMRNATADGVYDFYYYDDEEYWRQVNGGREGYLVRKVLRSILFEAE